MLGALSVAWLFLYARSTHVIDLPDPIDGVTGAENFNFEQNVGEFSKYIEYYPNELYTPLDFERGDTDDAQIRGEIPNASSIPYGTYRNVIKLPPNSYYSICGYSLDYNTKVFINGLEVLEIGTVSSDKDISEPRVNYMNIPVYSGESGMVEIILQYSNYVHKEGGGIPFLYISTPQKINRMIIEDGLPSLIMSGGLIVFAVYYFLDGILRKKRLGLQLALCCMLFAFRDQWFYLISLIPYEYNWYFHYRVIVATIMVTPLAVLTLIEASFPKVMTKNITSLFVVLNIFGLAAVFVLPTVHSVLISQIVQIGFAIPYLILLTYKIVRHYIDIKRFNLKDLYIISAITILCTTTIVEGVLNSYIPSITRGGLTPIGMLLFAIIYMAVLAVEANEDQATLSKSLAEQELLGKMNEMKTDFLSRMAHEIKTPLTVMSGYAQLTNIQIANNAVTEETSENLKVISTEAVRLAGLVSTLLEVPTNLVSGVSLNEIFVEEYLHYISIVCRGVLQKNNNELIVINNTSASILGNMEMLVQVMINLCINSNKHMTSGEFKVEVNETADENIIFYISDTGDGISAEHVDSIFDRGFSTSGTKGLGLHICREILQIHSGDIKLHKTDEKGTTFKITVPKYKAEE